VNTTTLAVCRWYVTDPSGKVLDSGYGQVPQDLLQRHEAPAGVKVVQQVGVQGSNTTRWEVKGPDGQVVASGEGQPPSDVFKVSISHSSSFCGPAI
jgi:hypothetical protein